MADVIVSRIQIEHNRETLGLGIVRPRISWQIVTEAQNWIQSGYELACFDAGGNLLAQTGRINSAQSILAAWPFEPLQSRQQVSLRVRVWGVDGSSSDWSAPQGLEAGLLQVSDWQARFITPAWAEDTTRANPAPYLRREFALGAGIVSARLYITALGLYEAQLNGAVVGDQVLAPGWTVYDKRLRYQTFDVTHLVREGANAIGAVLGDGWFRGRFGFGGGRRNIYGDQPGLLAQLEVLYADGARQVIASDQTWQASTGAILAAGIYEGETHDARLEKTGWTMPGFHAANWSGVKILERDLSNLAAPLSPPVRCIQRVRPVSIHQSPSGKTLVDFGQNLVGRLEMRVQGAAGQTVTLRHAEVLEHGELGTRPLRQAEATDRYTLGGTGIETWEPRFTFHGFRYVEVQDWPGELTLDALTAVVLHSDMERTGWFECSNSLLNQLHENVVWGMRGNFLDVPTDCPQRDERLGWTGDIQVFSPTASFLFDSSGFLQSWLVDLALEQDSLGGAVPAVVPNILPPGFGTAAAAWADAAVVVPWVLYQRFGDAGILADQFESMRAWVDHVAKLAGEGHLWNSGFQFGDWLDPTAPPDQPWQARTDRYIVASAYFARSASLVSQAAAVLGRTTEAEYYSTLAAQVRKAFADEYITPSGRMVENAETAYAMALEFDLLKTPQQRQRAGKQLAALVKEGGFHIRTGFVGTPLICDALCSTGHAAEAYRLLLQTECPSWLYPVTMGATTVWERWDSMLPDGSINPGEMTSFNHYALGAVADWMQRTIAGLALLKPGYSKLQIAPRPGGGLTHAMARHLTPYGLAESRWKLLDGAMELDVVVPPNATASVTLPWDVENPLEVGSGDWHWSGPYSLYEEKTGFTLNDTVGDVMSDNIVRKAILGIFEGVEEAGFLVALLQNEKTFTLRQVLAMVGNPAGLQAAFENALTKKE